MNAQLPISRLINVQVLLTPAAAQAQSLSDLLILGDSAVIDLASRMRSYASIAAVAADFGTSAPEYLAAVLWFEQAPQPTRLLIGRWARTAAAGQLVCGTLSAVNTPISAWNTITNGSLRVTPNGGAEQSLTGLNFTGAANLAAVAAIIQAALTGITVTYSASYNSFTFTSTTTGASSSVSFLTAGATGTSLHEKLGGTAGTGGFLSSGAIAETAQAAVAAFDDRFGQQWYGLAVLGLTPGADDASILAVAAYIEAATNKHVYAVTTQQAGVLNSATTTDIAAQLKDLSRDRAFVQYSSSNPYAAVSALARILTTDYNGNNTVITLMYKQEPGIVAETLNASQMQAAADKNCNVFVAYNNDTAILEPGKSAGGEFFDIITFTDWLAITIQTAFHNLLYTSTTKIPQTDEGAHLFVTTAESICAQGVVNGGLAPGVWNANGFGQLKQGDLLPKGFYVYCPPMATQNPADRVARKCPPIQIAAKLAGAIHYVNTTINVNQ